MRTSLADLVRELLCRVGGAREGLGHGAHHPSPSSTIDLEGGPLAGKAATDTAGGSVSGPLVPRRPREGGQRRLRSTRRPSGIARHMAVSSFRANLNCILRSSAFHCFLGVDDVFVALAGLGPLHVVLVVALVVIHHWLCYRRDRCATDVVVVDTIAREQEAKPRCRPQDNPQATDLCRAEGIGFSASRQTSSTEREHHLFLYSTPSSLTCRTWRGSKPPGEELKAQPFALLTYWSS